LAKSSDLKSENVDNDALNFTSSRAQCVPSNVSWRFDEGDFLMMHVIFTDVKNLFQVLNVILHGFDCFGHHVQDQAFLELVQGKHNSATSLLTFGHASEPEKTMLTPAVLSATLRFHPLFTICLTYAGSSTRKDSPVVLKLKNILDEPLESTGAHDFQQIEYELSNQLKFPLDVQGPLHSPDLPVFKFRTDVQILICVRNRSNYIWSIQRAAHVDHISIGAEEKM
jgi:hypothetical protein